MSGWNGAITRSGFAAAVHDPQWGGDDDGAHRRQSIEIAQAGQAELPGAVHDSVWFKREWDSPA